MTISAQVKQVLAGLKKAQAELEGFALETQNQQAKNLYSDAAQQTKNVVENLEPRLTQIESEEPQYKS